LFCSQLHLQKPMSDKLSCFRVPDCEEARLRACKYMPRQTGRQSGWQWFAGVCIGNCPRLSAGARPLPESGSRITGGRLTDLFRIGFQTDVRLCGQMAGHRGTN